MGTVTGDDELESVPPPSWRTRLRSGFKRTVVVLLVLVLAGLVYQWIGTVVDMRRYPPSGQLVAVDERRLHIHCQGTGSPTVILETLSGGISSYWGWVQPEIAQETRTCVYDRSGRAWSGASAPQDVAGGVATLHALLANAGEAGPYVMVGHSIGGVYSLLFAHEYPDEVAGVVLVDASHPSQYARYPDLVQANRDFLAIARILPLTAHLGIPRLYFDLGGQMDFGDLPDQAFAESAAWWSRPDYFASVYSEIAQAEANFEYAHRVLSGMTLDDLPLVVVSAEEAAVEGWQTLQQELSELSSNSIHLYVDGSNHSSLAFYSDHAHQTSQAVLHVVRAVRSGDRIAQ